MPLQPDHTPSWTSWAAAQVLLESIVRNQRGPLTLPQLARLVHCQSQLLYWKQPGLNGRQEPPPLDPTSVQTRLTQMLDEPLAQVAKTLVQLPSVTEMMKTSVLLENREGSVVVLPGSGPEDRVLRVLTSVWAQTGQQLNHLEPTSLQQLGAATVAQVAAYTQIATATASSPSDLRTPALLSRSARLTGQYAPSPATRNESQERPAPRRDPAPSRRPGPPPPARSR